MKIIKDLCNSQYRAQKGWSKSDLDLINKSPCLIEWNKAAPQGGSDSVDLGTHLHCLILEPDRFATDYIVAPDFNLRTKAGKEDAASFKAESFSSGKIVIDHATSETLQAMRASLLAHPIAKNLLIEESGENEVSVFSEINGTKVKCRPDRLLKKPIIIDLKKTADIETFAKSARAFRYDVQAAFYSDILKPFFGVTPDFYFVAVGEKRQIGRHPVRVFKMSNAAINAAREVYMKDLDIAKDIELFGTGFHVETIF